MEDLRIERGQCHMIFAYDTARAINLNEAERRIQETSERPAILHKRRAPNYFEFRAPLRVTHQCQPLQVGPFWSGSTVDIVLYDFGAIAVNYTISLEGSFAALLPLSDALYANALLLADSRQRIEALLKVIGETAAFPEIAPLVEDYAIFHIEGFVEPFETSRFCETHGPLIAQILRAEKRPLSEQEVADVLAARMSYGEKDVVIVDWNAALLVDREGEDIRAVLHFANVELLEMRHLDQRLDWALDQSWEAVSKKSSRTARKLGRYGTGLRAIAELQVDNASLFEGVNNALKLLGDEYLARIYRLVSRRFHLDDWDTGILRKLGTLESIYQKMSDQAATRRMEVLEWIIIILFVFSIVLELLHFGSS